MPIYDYLCADCGHFTEIVPMAAYEAAAECPSCGANAARAILSVPHLSGMDRSRFKAHAVNEKSAHAPESSARTGRHPVGCSCCKASSAKPGAAKGFPGTRPWMISH